MASPLSGPKLEVIDGLSRLFSKLRVQRSRNPVFGPQTESRPKMQIAPASRVYMSLSAYQVGALQAYQAMVCLLHISIPGPQIVHLSFLFCFVTVWQTLRKEGYGLTSQEVW